MAEVAMVKVKVLKDYNDMVLKEVLPKDHEMEVTEERAKKLVEEKMVKIIIPEKSK